MVHGGVFGRHATNNHMSSYHSRCQIRMRRIERGCSSGLEAIKCNQRLFERQHMTWNENFILLLAKTWNHPAIIFITNIGLSFQSSTRISKRCHSPTLAASYTRCSNEPNTKIPLQVHFKGQCLNADSRPLRRGKHHASTLPLLVKLHVLSRGVGINILAAFHFYASHPHRQVRSRDGFGERTSSGAGSINFHRSNRESPITCR